MLTRDFFETDRIRKLFEARDAENSLSVPEIPRNPTTTSTESSLSSMRNVRSIAVQPEQAEASVEVQQQQKKISIEVPKQYHRKVSIEVQHENNLPSSRQNNERTKPDDNKKDNLQIKSSSTTDVKEKGVRRGSDVSTISLHGRVSPTYL